MVAGMLVWSERADLAEELLGQARRLSDELGGGVYFCASGAIGGPEVATLAARGADIVYMTDKQLADPAQWVDVLCAVIAEAQPSVVLVGATKTGMEVAPRIAERLDAAYGAWAVDINLAGEAGGTTADCMLYAGTGLGELSVLARPLTILTVAAGTFERRDDKGRTARVESVVLTDGGSRLRIVGERPKPAGSDRLEEAKAVVDIGRGVKNLEDLELLRCSGRAGWGPASLLEARVFRSRLDARLARPVGCQDQVRAMPHRWSLRSRATRNRNPRLAGHRGGQQRRERGDLLASRCWRGGRPLRVLASADRALESTRRSSVLAGGARGTGPEPLRNDRNEEKT